jgi:hypothetical protein
LRRLVQACAGRRRFEVSSADLDSALAGILNLRDAPGKSKIDPNAHGSGFDRVGAFQDGYDNGLGNCKDYRDDNPIVLELSFRSEADPATGGDAPYEWIVNGVPYDLEGYWTQVYPELAEGQAWTPLVRREDVDAARRLPGRRVHRKRPRLQPARNQRLPHLAG